MRGLIADANFIGQLDRLVAIFLSQEWVAFWNDLDLSMTDFNTIGLAPDANDRTVWERCQAEALILITGNRNDDGPESLESVIRNAPPEARPVFTVGDGRRLMTDGTYARSVAIDLLEYLIDLRERPDLFLGLGRLYLPK